MKINGSTVGTPTPRSNFNQTDPKKADYIIGRENIVDKTDLTSVTKEILAEAKASGEFDGKDGQDGYTPIKGVDYFDGQDGADGQNGKDGYTPIKGVDYFDGKDGKDGADGYTPQKGIDYFDGKDGKDGESYTLTEQDKADIAAIVLSEMPETSTYTGEVEVI